MPSHSDLSNGRAAAYHDNSYHGEDTYIIREVNGHSVLDAVLDGATARGGADASGYVAELLQGATIETIDGVASLLEVANQRLFQRGEGRFFLTTASVALKLGSTLHVVSVGDSPVFLIRGRDIVPLTPSTNGRTFPGMMNALGHRERLSYKATSIGLQAQDRLVLATDGLIENVAPSELATLMDDTPSPEAAVSALRQLLCAKKRQNKGRDDDGSGFRRDDATAIIRYFSLSPLQEPPGSPESTTIA
jgi:serine/threonine protein phosphatase PrpC